LVVVPSIPSLRREGSSIVAAEAARHGRPVVTSDDPAVAEVSSGVGGQIVPAGDVAALASALDRWLGDGLAAAEAGHLARQAASAAYDVDTIRSEVDTVYESVMGLSSGR
jgi:phosphatidylinositol alpha-mannosyltransferase